jgi:hypothetical protein
VPPGFAHKIAQSPLTNNAAALQENWTAAKEYLDRDNVLATCTQLAGDLLYVPRLWMHATRALEECVGVALEFCSAVSVFMCVVFCCAFVAKHCPSSPSLLRDPQRTNAAILVVCLFDEDSDHFFFFMRCFLCFFAKQVGTEKYAHRERTAAELYGSVVGTGKEFVGGGEYTLEDYIVPVGDGRRDFFSID